MGRAPCCAKMGLKKGPWSPEEDEILINYIRLHGHSNWRALPKHAGLLRCGKSCRLRWTNYLRPDIKRGNFTPDEEQTIINLHELLGNRWSAIAAKLPGRTDNEIKNVWHTHLKKRLPKQDELQMGPTAADNGPTVPDGVVGPTKMSGRKPKSTKKKGVVSEEPKSKHVKGMKNKNNNNNNINSTNKNNDNNNSNNNNNNDNENNSDNNDDDNNVRPTMSSKGDPISPQPCTSEVSTITTSTSTSENGQCCKEDVREVKKEGYIDDLSEFSDDFWMEVLSVEDTAMSTEEFPCISQCCTDTSPVYTSESNVHCDDMDFFWHNLLTRSDDLTEISDIL